MSINLPSRRLVSQEDASFVERATVPRSRFSGSWTRKTAFDAGYLYPIMVEEVLPGDHLSYEVTAYVRLATPLFPLFDNQRIDTFFFFVPARLLWANWERFLGSQPTGPSQSIDLTIPQVVSPVGGFAEFSIWDHFGLPCTGQIDAAETITVNALPLRAYNQIWNQWFRDQNIDSAVSYTTSDGPDSSGGYSLLQRAKSHDYFTSALPWPQKFTAPTVPVGGLAPVTGIGAIGDTGIAGPQLVDETFFGSVSYDAYRQLFGSPASASNNVLMKMSDTTNALPEVYADLSEATGVAIETFRQAWMIQALLERDARGGTRYPELIFAHWGVRVPDFRVQRPEYIGGGSSPLNITPIAQTAPDASSVVGQLGAAGTSSGQHRASYAAQEHGYIIGLINVKSELSYQQGIRKLWSRQTRYDFYVPALAGLGEQAILRQELYATGVDADDQTVFGYQERWHEYRANHSEVVGIMRSQAAGTLDAWHLAQSFATPPTLNSTFIRDTPPMSRVLAAGALATNQQYLADILFKRTAVRPIPQYGTPAIMGRF